MSKGRLEAFSDGVIAIIITVMVLALRTPNGADLGALVPLLPVVLTYILSFIFLAIYWNNHHHLFQVVERVNGSVLWANLNLLFWLSLIPFVTGWMGQNPAAPWPVACYGIVLLLAACAYFVLVRALLALHGGDSKLAAAIGEDLKGKLSVLFYAAAIPASFVHVGIAYALFVLVAAIWLVPDSRIERTLAA